MNIDRKNIYEKNKKKKRGGEEETTKENIFICFYMYTT